MAMAEIGAIAGNGVNRAALSPEDVRARALLLQWAGVRGWQAAVDPISAGEFDALIGTLPSYYLVDFAMGLQQSGYRITLFVDNVFDERAVSGRYTECAITTCFGEQYDVVAQPLTVGIRFGRSF